MVIALPNQSAFPETVPLTGHDDVVRLAQIGIRYGGKPEISSDLTLSLARGSFHYLYGATGCGKTSLLQLMAGNLPPARGVISLFGRDVSRFTRKNLSAIRRKIGIVFQDFRLIDHMTAFDNIALPLRLEKRPEDEIRVQVLELLAWMGLGDLKDCYPDTLSSGARQRVAIARAIIHRPALLLADEPTAHVDDKIAHRLMRMLAELNNLGTTVVVATHKTDLIQRFPHPCLWLRHGGITRISASDVSMLWHGTVPGAVSAPPTVMPAAPPAPSMPVKAPPVTTPETPLQDTPDAIPDWPDFEQLLSPLRHIEKWRR